MKTFIIDKRFGLTDTMEEMGEGQSSRKKLQASRAILGTVFL